MREKKRRENRNKGILSVTVNVCLHLNICWERFV